MAFVWVLCVGAVLGALGTCDIHRGVLLQNHGVAVIIDEYALIKLNVSIIHENEKSLKMLQVILRKYLVETTNPTRVRIIKGLLEAVDEELGVGAVKRRKQSLLPFVGTALKSMFGLTTEADHNRAQGHLD